MYSEVLLEEQEDMELPHKPKPIRSASITASHIREDEKDNNYFTSQTLADKIASIMSAATGGYGKSSSGSSSSSSSSSIQGKGNERCYEEEEEGEEEEKEIIDIVEGDGSGNSNHSKSLDEDDKKIHVIEGDIQVRKHISNKSLRRACILILTYMTL